MTCAPGPVARWAIKEMVREQAWLVFLPGGRWIPASQRPRTEMGLPAPRRFLLRRAVLQLEESGILTRSRTEPDAFDDPRRLTPEGWELARRLLTEKQRQLVAERMPLRYPG
jgi:hypothetical protein